MSSSPTSVITTSSNAAGKAPGCENTITCSLSTISVGIDRMPNEPAISGWLSVSTLPNTMSGCCSEAASKMGPNIRQGPHHEAQKSTNTVAFDDTTSLKFSSVSSTVATALSPPSPAPDQT